MRSTSSSSADGGKAESDTVSLVFGGAGETLVLGEADSACALAEMTEFSVNDHVDGGGNDAGISQLTFRVTDADGDAVSGTNVFVEQGKVW